MTDIEVNYQLLVMSRFWVLLFIKNIQCIFNDLINETISYIYGKFHLFYHTVFS